MWKLAGMNCSKWNNNDEKPEENLKTKMDSHMEIEFDDETGNDAVEKTKYNFGNRLTHVKRNLSIGCLDSSWCGTAVAYGSVEQKH